VLEELGSFRIPGANKVNVAVPMAECQIQKYWVYGVEVLENVRRNKLRRPQPEFRRNDWNHHDGEFGTQASFKNVSGLIDAPMAKIG
jgi:hypothetical protein